MKKKRTKKLSKNKRLLLLVLAGIVIIVGALLLSNKIIINEQEVVEPEVTSNYQPKEAVVATEEQTVQEKTTVVANPEPEPAPSSEWPVTYTTEQASSLTVVVNKKHKLPENYAPGLRQETSNALTQLVNDASSAGIELKTISAYRSYSTQVSTYNKWVTQSGQAAADTFSARPGHSEHQTGLAVDLGNGTCDLEICFGDTPAGQWLAFNAQNYGFIIRYPNGKNAVTGYQYEPWHLRYLGVDVAKAVVASGLTLDQYYGVEAGGY